MGAYAAVLELIASNGRMRTMVQYNTSARQYIAYGASLNTYNTAQENLSLMAQAITIITQRKTIYRLWRKPTLITPRKTIQNLYFIELRIVIHHSFMKTSSNSSNITQYTS